MHACDDGKVMDDETSVFAAKMEAACEEMCAMFDDNSDDDGDAAVTHAAMEGMAPATPSNSSY